MTVGLLVHFNMIRWCYNNYKAISVPSYKRVDDRRRAKV